MIPRSKHIGCLPLGHHGTNRHTTPQRFRRSKHIWLHTQLLMSPQTSTPPHTHLNFITNQQRSIIITQLPCRSKELHSSRTDTPLSLQWFHHNRRNSTLPSLPCILFRSLINLLHQRLQLLHIIIRSVLKPPYHLPTIGKPLVILGLSRRRHSRQCPPMKRILRRDNHRIGNSPIIGMSSCQFDRCFVTFRSRIAKEGFVGAGVGA
mmetsp:Transcript_3914/g.5727  ORF Transcript_3914/g.5727 Transcript_3914/m.5727 type:complete len:206 (+) Transcript_3914:565-1182(+)